MSDRSHDDAEITVGADRVSIRGGAYEDLRPLVQGAVGVATPFVECLEVLTGLSVGWVNRKLTAIAMRYEGKLRGIPEARRQLPALEIAASAVRGAAVAAESVELQELFAELLAAASDSERCSSPHPSFGSLISELDSLDAKILALFGTLDRRAELHQVVATKALRLDLFDDRIPVALSSLKRQGLIEKSSSRVGRSFHRRFTYHADPEKKLDLLREELSEVFESMSDKDWPIRLTPYGRQFVAACIASDGL